MQQKTPLILQVCTIILLTLIISGCFPIHLPKSERADAQPEYRTKYFAVMPPKGQWTAKISTPSFIVPLEGNILAEVMSERISFWSVPSVTPVFPLQQHPALTISSCPTPEPIPELNDVKIGDKTFYKLRSGYIAVSNLWYFTPDRAYEFGGFYILNRDRVKMDSELLRVIERFEPVDFKASTEGLLLEKTLILSHSLKWGHCFHGKRYSFEEITKAYQNVINENPNNYVAHLFLGIHYLIAKEAFYETVIAPKIKENPKEIEIKKIKRIGDAKQVLTKNMEKFDLYRLNIIWIVNKKDFYSYFLQGNFDDKAAMAEFKKALEIKPDSYAARYFLSWLYLRTGEYGKAASEYKKLLEKDPQDADALLMLRAAHKAMGLEKEAKEFYDALKRVTRTGTLYDFLDNFIGPALTSSLQEAINHAIRLR
jgi:tetratricopeptide (TPR) repeat protein